MKSLILALVLLCSSYAHAQVTTGGTAAKTYKPAVASPAALPTTGNTAGDTRVTLTPMAIYGWDGASWIDLGSSGAGVVTSVFGRIGAVVATSGDYNTSQVTENTNLYYTAARFNTAFGAKTTDNLTEGATNLYFTNARASSAAPVQTVAGRTGNVVLANTDISGLGTASTQNSTAFDAAGAAAAAQAFSIQRANHTGTQLAATISDFSTASKALFSATAPLVDTAGVFSMPASTDAVDGYMSAAEHTQVTTNTANIATNTSAIALKEDVANKDTDGTLAANSDTKYPSQKAIKTYVTTGLATKEPTITATTSADFYRGDKTFQTLNTLAVPELTNLYYTQARFDTAFGLKSTTNLSEGTNLYFTNARGIASTLTGYASGAGTVAATDTILQAIQKLNGNIAAIPPAPVSSVFGRTGAVLAVSGDYDTLKVTENTNLYFTNARAIAATSATAPIVDTAGVFSMPASTDAVDGYMSAAEHTQVTTNTANIATNTTNIALKENLANKDTDGTLAANSDTKYPSQKATKTYADAKVADAIADSVTTIAPSQNAVFDALALKKNIADSSAYYVGPAGSGRPYTTISAALTAMGAATSAADFKAAKIVYISGGSYDESLTIPRGRLLTLVAEGTVILGDGAGANFGSTTPRSITFQPDSADIFGSDVKPALNLVGMANNDPTSTFLAEAGGFIISGSLNIDGSGVSHTVNLSNTKISGAITKTTAGLTNLQGYKLLVVGASNLSAGSTILERCYDCEFDALLTVDGYNAIINSEFKAGMTVVTNFNTLPPSGFFLTTFTGTFTGPANSLKLDLVSDYFFRTNAATLGGSATKVLLSPVATTAITGSLSAADWTTFNAKQSALTNSAGLAAALSDETGTGFAVFSVSPAFTGTPTVPTAAPLNNSTQAASTAYVEAAIAAIPAGSGGTVTSVSVVSANGMAGTVATATTTPAITLSTTVTGITKGNGTALSAATAGTDYLSPTSSNITGNTTGVRTVTQYFGDTTGGAFTFTYPAAASNTSVMICVKNITLGGANNITLARTGADTLEGGTTGTIAAGEQYCFTSNGTNWLLAQ